MKTATFEYKCRRCGKIITKQSTGTPLALDIILHLTHGTKIPEIKIGSIPSLTTFHLCDKKQKIFDSNVGIADLIGYEVE